MPKNLQLHVLCTIINTPQNRKNQNSFIRFTVFNNIILLKTPKNDKTFTSNEDIGVHEKHEQ